MSHHEKQRIGNYVIGKEIGKGSFATVYKGYRHVRQPSFRIVLTAAGVEDARTDRDQGRIATEADCETA